MTEYRLIYVTVASAEEGATIARAAVGERLAACANLLPPVRSFYWWEGEVRDDPEQVLVLKTRQDRVAALRERVVALHSYDVPCVVALPIIDGHPAYLAWLGDALEGEAG